MSQALFSRIFYKLTIFIAHTFTQVVTCNYNLCLVNRADVKCLE